MAGEVERRRALLAHDRLDVEPLIAVLIATP